MAVVTLASADDLAEWLGESFAADSPEGKRAVWCLRAASALVRKESGRTWLTETGQLVSPLPDDLVTVTLYVASRVFDNREAQTRGGLDDWSEGWKVEESGAYLTESERRTVSSYRKGMGGLGVVATSRGDFGVSTASGWVPTDTPDVFFPWY